MNQGFLCGYKELKEFCSNLFIGYGFTKEHANSIADCLITTDMRGIRSHGIVRVDMYLTQLKKGAIRSTGIPKVIKETNTTAVIDGDNAAGAPVCDMAVKIAREKADKNGISLVTVKSSNHFGPAGHWSTKLAGDDMIGFATTNSIPLLAAPTSKTAVIGNNPFSLAVTTGKGEHMSVDISNGKMAFGKIHEYRRLNKPFPENNWLDDKGNPTTDPFATDFLKFVSLPFGMHKGFCLAVMVEAITSMLSGGPVASEIVPPGGDADANNSTSHTFMAIKIDSFCEPKEYKNTVDRFIDYLYKIETRNENDKVFYPGEIENISYRKALKEGIVIPENVKNSLLSAADKISMTVDLSIFKEISN